MNLSAPAVPQSSAIPTALPRFFRLALAAYLLSSILPALHAQTVTVDTTRPVNSFRPTEALGAGVDRIPLAATD
jgi:hypothetical protein